MVDSRHSQTADVNYFQIFKGKLGRDNPIKIGRRLAIVKVAANLYGHSPLSPGQCYELQGSLFHSPPNCVLYIPI